ncbi:VCBS repeat-containing protein [Neolewinella aquimaris]|uniref:VCBS repeat-containing protein n=1 Tax=Neolewinella aquimaris TaxID=1835722 RepID=UPI001C8627FE|nr:VCBS repeat-containing protein [Neolewinella aquimaris]
MLCLSVVGCRNDRSAQPARISGFTHLSAADSGIDFANTITESDSLNYFTYPYLFLGNGVAAADFDRDGLTDLFFTGAQVGNRMYRNLGDFAFGDITTTAGLEESDLWATGVTTLDINADGWMDLYVCAAGPGDNRQNRLYLNQTDGTFREAAAEYGLADESHSMQATALDYDGDGLVDLLVANYANVPVTQGNEFYGDRMRINAPEESIHLYRNTGRDTFVDVTEAAGLQRFSLALGVVAQDFNGDGLPDLYISNDFNVPDYFFVNRGDGSFSEELAESFPHTSMFGMGIDAGDLNNDGRADLVQLDMTAADYRRAKTNMASMRPEAFYRGVELGFHYQYMQNTLQLNRGNGVDGRARFSDVAQLSGVAATDWSWGTLLADLDNDGYRDLFITNGIKRDVNNNDVNASFRSGNFFGGSADRDYRLLPSRPIANFCFRNPGTVPAPFEQVQTQWGLDQPGFSQGVVAADLDNDGDLDLVLNNMDAPAGIYRNEVTSNYLKVSLTGPPSDPLALNARVQVFTGDTVQTAELTLTRGYFSAQPRELHFGLGDRPTVDSIVVRWRDGSSSQIGPQSANQTITVSYADDRIVENQVAPPPPPFADITSLTGLDFRHQEDDFDEFQYQPLLPHRYSRLGPGMAVGDVNGDGLDDLFCGGARRQNSQLYLQTIDGKFESAGPSYQFADAELEVTGALFFDADGDGDDDLYVVHGGNDRQQSAATLQDRLYVNTPGGLVAAPAALPDLVVSGQAVAATDFDGDGDLDLFVGGRLVPGRYPHSPTSHLLLNEGGTVDAPRFRDVTAQRCPALSAAGMITSATWADVDGDGRPDLLTAGEWTAVTVYLQRADGSFEARPAAPDRTGWYYALTAADVDQDGDIDLLAGNLGQNYKYRADDTHSFEVYANDFDGNGREDIVLSKSDGSTQLPLRGRECSAQQIPAISKRFTTYSAFADADLRDIYGEALETSLHYVASDFSHQWFENDGSGRFQVHQLPASTQISSINSIVPLDYNGDAYPDFLLAGNLLHAEVETTRNDAGYGSILLGGPDGPQATVAPHESGLWLYGEVRGVPSLNIQGQPALVIARNGLMPVIYARQ